MKKLLFTAVVAFMASACVAQSSNTKTYTTSNQVNGVTINGIDASSAFQITVTQGATSSAIVTIPDRYKDALEYRMDGNTLELGFRDNTRINLKNGEKCTAEVVCPSLNEVDLSGACSIKFTNAMTTTNLKFDLSGASKVTSMAPITVSGRLDIDLSGASQLSLSGTVNTCEIEASGASDIDLSNMEAEMVDIDVSGASQSTVWATKQIRLEASGASKIRYKGDPNVNYKESSGASSIQKM